MATIDAVVGAYISLRDKKKEVAARHREEMAVFNDKMNQIETFLLMDFGQKGIESAKTESGTAYKVSRRTVKSEDWEAFIEYVRENDLWHMLDRRSNKSAVEEFLEANGELPPGLSITTSLGINVRR